MKKIYMILILLFVAAGCSNENVKTPKEVVIKEIYQTHRDTIDNVDSPAFWENGSLNLLIATAKETHRLLVYNAENGEHIKNIGNEGEGELQFKRPNGIAVIDDYLLVVERDNQRVQILSLPDFNFVGFVTDSLLTNPYGLNIVSKGNGYRLYVTDNYETETEEIPADSLLDKRIHIYDLTINDNQLNYNLVKFAGATTGKGILSIVESVFLDQENDNLVISEEDETQSSIKIYDSEGNSKEKVFGLGLFKYQVEGIALYKKENGNGFWIVTDQSHEKNRFMIFDRKTFEYKGAFIGKNTTNTDGVWLTQKSFGNFKKGAFFAIHDDGNVSAFNLSVIINDLKL
ncbi:MAG: phytase [Rhodothermaceae bacterium]